MLRRALLFVLAFAVGYRVAYVAVDAAGGAALRFPWRDSPRLAAGATALAVRARVTDPIRDRLADARAALDEGRETAREREQELRSENHLRQSS